MPLVSIGIVTWHSAREIAECLAAVRAQEGVEVELVVADNDSRDGTRAILERETGATERVYFDRNTGFSAAHNALIRRSRGEAYLALNPDVVLDRRYAARLLEACAAHPRAGSATGKLLRREPPGTIDSTGIVMTPSMRHLDRGAGEVDRGQYEQPGEVFGASGAAALYTRALLDEVRVEDEWFDEDFFAYREDADLAWRARLLGWRCRYVPGAVATHVRRVTPERRAALPPEVNRWSVRNRFLLRLKNQTWRHALAFAGPALARDAQVVGYVLLREHGSIGGLMDVVRLLPRTLRKRRAIMARRRATDAELAPWFRQAREAR
jgi:GT2 family glycosyltransferase